MVSTQEIPVTLITREHVLRGQLAAHGTRLLDLISESDTDFLHLRDATICRRQTADCVATLPEAVVRKADVGLAIPNGDAHEAPEKRITAYVAKQTFRVFLTVLGCEVRGTYHVGRGPSPVAVLTGDLGRFIPLSEATWTSAGHETPTDPVKVAIVNHALISMMQLEKPANQPPDLSAAIRELISS